MALQSFSPAVYRERVTAAQELVAAKQLSGLIIGTGPELAYLTGSWISSHERLTALVITADRATLVAPLTDIDELKQVDLEVLGWRDGEDAHRLAAGLLPVGEAVGLGSSLTADHVLALRAHVRGEFLLATDVLAELFMVKDAAEIAQLRQAGRAIDRVHAQVPRLLQAGRREADVAEDLKRLIAQEHDGVDFVIVGSGPNGANPHHSWSDRVLEPGDPVVVDIGGSVGAGYRSDCTRTYVVPGAAPPADFLAAYAVLERAQAAGVAAVRPGVSAQEIDRVTRGVLADASLDQLFSHRTGHGIGLSTHEQPYIVEGNDVELLPGMAFSVEPGLYLAGRWGMRIEDIVVVTDTGAESLNFQPRVLG